MPRASESDHVTPPLKTLHELPGTSRIKSKERAHQGLQALCDLAASSPRTSSSTFASSALYPTSYPAALAFLNSPSVISPQGQSQ